MLVITLGLVSCGGGNQSSSTGSSVTAQATTATVSACNASASFGGAGPLLTDTTNPTLEACNAAIAFTCNASMSFGGTEPALTATSSPSIKTCLAVMNESNSNGANGAKVLAGQMTIWSPYANGGCGNSTTYGGWGPALFGYQLNYCTAQASVSPNTQDCNNLGGISSGGPYNFICGICC